MKLIYCIVKKNKRNKTKQQKKGNENVHVPGLFSVVLTFPFSVLWLKGEWGSALASRLSCCTWGLSFICLVPGLGREVLPPFVRVLLFQWLQSVVLVPKCEMDKPVPHGTNSGGLWAASLVSAQSCCRQAVSRVSAMCAKPGLLQQSRAEEDCVRISEENMSGEP